MDDQFQSKCSGDEEWEEGMRCLYGSGDKGHEVDVDGAIEYFMKGVEKGSLLCVGAMASCYEGLPGFPPYLNKFKDWHAKKMALIRKEEDWIDWTYERAVLTFGTHSEISRYYEELSKATFENSSPSVLHIESEI